MIDTSVDAGYDLLGEYARDLTAEGKAKRTVESYTPDARRFLEYHCILNRKQLGQTCRQEVMEFLDHVRTLRLKPATHNKIVNSLSCFFQYLCEREILPDGQTLVIPKRDRVKIALGSEKEVTVLTDAQVDALLRSLDKSTEVSQRDRLIVLFLLYTGCRVTELVETRLGDLDLLVGTVVVRGKGDKLREIPLRPDLSKEIQKYIGGERTKSRHRDSKYLFVSVREAKLNRDTVNTILERLVRVGQFSFHLHPHLFRHTFASRLVAINLPLTTVQRLAGHASVQTTAHFYVNTSRQDKQDAVRLLKKGVK